jgi:hypothetical protein
MSSLMLCAYTTASPKRRAERLEHGRHFRIVMGIDHYCLCNVARMQTADVKLRARSDFSHRLSGARGSKFTARNGGPRHE